MASYVLGIDIGTTGTKGILLHPECGIVCEAQATSRLRSPQVGWAEEDPRQWWDNVAEVTAACLGEAAVRPSDIAAVGTSGMAPTLILLDARGEVLRPSIQQNDARSEQEIEYFRGQVDRDVVLQRTGSAITQQSIGPKLLWLRRHEPEVMNRAMHVMGSYDYIAHRLTGSYSCERNWALESGLFDLHREDWDDDLLRLATISRDWLGRVCWPTDIVGEVSPEAAEHNGIAPGTPVVAGSADHIASAFSAGIKSPGDLLIKLGGAGDILYDLNHVLVDPRLYLDYHVIPGKYLINGCMAASGSIIRWFKENFAVDSEYSTLDAEASTVPPGSQGLVLLPYFLGEKTPVNDPLARGVLLGLTLSHTRAHVHRAILEGISYGFRHHLAVLAERDLGMTRCRVSNGGTRSGLWKQITADVLGVELEEIVGHPGSSLGAAFVAGKGVALFKDWTDIERFVTVAGVVEPDMSAHDTYEELFTVYRNAYDCLKPEFPILSRVALSREP